MKIEKDTIVFKSFSDPYLDEKDGKKPNTVRLLSKHEVDEVEDKWGCIDYIQIVKSNGEESFKRPLSDISDVTEYMGEFFQKKISPYRLYVFSWVGE